MEVKQYHIILVNLDPTIGSEIKKTRPYIVISPNEMNKHLLTIVIAPMTTTLKKHPTRVEIVHNSKKGYVVIDRIRTIDKARIIKSLGELSNKESTEIKNVIRECYVD
ncbi:MAG: type II toxin-antitoxin system PemK/MazF family toxin [Cyclobacteriaceae bacterium]|nr:type II toxin-antitoxin system PemK/MazF family toxin [Cyclobacteriaceae bacterium]